MSILDLQRNDKARNNVVVPVDKFIMDISKETGWSVKTLGEKDLGDIERHLNIEAKPPVYSLSIKRGKSRTPLYSFVNQDTTRYVKTKTEKTIIFLIFKRFA